MPVRTEAKYREFAGAIRGSGSRNDKVGICALLTLLSLALLTSACSESMESTIVNGLRESKSGKICTRDHLFYTWTVGVATVKGDADHVLSVPENEGALAILVEAGLLGPPVDKSESAGNLFTRGTETSTRPAHPVTESGRHYIELVSTEGEGIFMKSPKGLCYAELEVDEVIDFTEPTDIMGKTAVEARFRWKAELEEWATSDSFRETFVGDTKLDGEGVAWFVKTNKGWRLENVNWNQS